ncbi:MAG TPA: amino acid permease [Planctomycetota bacterium]|nr:amino acid permease [Planctomycetota bacterium]
MSEAKGELRRDLGLVHIFCIASGAMISSGLFILPGLAYAKVGPAVIVCYFLAGLLSIPGMLSIAEMATAMPKAGADCFTVIRSLGPGMGTVAGLLSWFSLSMKSAFALVGMSIFTILLVDVDIRVIAIGCCLVFMTVNVLGIKGAGRTQLILAAGLFSLMALYVALGLPAVSVQRLEPFTPKGGAAVFFVTGYVFISYGGLLKIASVAEEIRNPTRNIPLGMILSLLVVSIFYALMVLVTVGVLEGEVLSGSRTPISDGAAVFMGRPGRIALSIAAVLAFLTTANAGIMTAARSLVPLSGDRLFPQAFGRINLRFGTPHNALLLTGAFVITSLFLKLDVLVEAASIVLILTNVLSCVSVIILRESGLQNYRPRFRCPLYPWLQVAGLIGLGFVLLGMGWEGYVITAALSLAGFCAYWFYGRKRTRQESALLHLVQRITARELVTGTLEEELKQIIRDRDGIVQDRFDRIIEQCVVLDIEEPVSLDRFLRVVAEHLSERMKTPVGVLVEALRAREAESSTALSPDIAIPHLITQGDQTFDVLLARSRDGIAFSESAPKVHGIFVLAGTRDERNFHLRALSAVAQIVGDPEFMGRWMKARSTQALRDLVLLGRRRRK